MAENKSTPNARHDFPEVRGKVVDALEIVVESDYCGLSIRFEDQTSLTVALEPCIFAFPAYAEWANGEEKVINKYQPIQSAINRA